MSKKEENKKKVLKSRVYELVTLLIHPDTGEEIITIEDIEGVLNTYSSIKDYAYIVHDKDTYTEEDIKKDGVDKSKLGTLKPKHIHVVMRSIRAQELETVAKWFGFGDKPNFIKKWGGKGGFSDAMLYLIHASEKQQKLGKHRYSEEEVTCSLQSGETYSEFIHHIEERLEKFGKPQPYKAEIYTEQQLIELLNKIKDDPLIYLIILTSFLGLRRSEVLGLKWNSVNFETKEILIKETVVRNKTTISKKKTKNESSYRSYPLSDDIFNIILLLKEDEKKNAKKWGGKYNKNDYIFKHSDGRPFTPNYVSQHFKLILEKNSFKHIRFHDLRHSCASLFLAKGHSLKEIQLWLGHSNFSTTADIYAHLDTNSKKNMAETMSEVGKIALDKTLDTE